MNLGHLSDKLLLSETEKLVFEERHRLTVLLHHLGEIDRRRLFAALGYSSIFEYATRKLHYPEDQAYRRVVATRMLKELPEIETKIANGALNLTHIGMAKSAFGRKGLTRESKLEILSELEGCSTRQAAKILAKYSSNKILNDSIRRLNSDQVELRFIANDSIEKKIELARGYLAHKYPSLTLGELFEILCDALIDNRTISAAPRKSDPVSHAALRRQILARSHCENCQSTYALEIDHIIPRAQGGTDAPENLRLLCRNCNQRAAIEKLGQVKMDEFLN